MGSGRPGVFDPEAVKERVRERMIEKDAARIARWSKLAPLIRLMWCAIFASVAVVALPPWIIKDGGPFRFGFSFLFSPPEFASGVDLRIVLLELAAIWLVTLGLAATIRAKR